MLTAATMLHGRGSECRMIDELLSDLRAGIGGGLLFTGQAGIGKTALLEYAAARAGAADVLMVRGVEAERDLPFAGLHALLGPARHLLPALPAHQGEALAAILGSRPVPAADPYVVAAGTLNLLAAAEGRRRLLLADDLHLLDDASRRALLFVARRAAGAGVGVVCTSDSAAEGHRLEPLDAEAAGALLRGAGPVPLPDTVADALLDTCCGLPVALAEIPGVLEPPELSGAAPLPDPLPVGPRVRGAVRRSLAGLTAPQWDALLVVAAAGDAGLLAVRAVLEELGLAESELEAVEAAGVVSCHGNEVAFRLPIARCAVYEQGDVARRRRVHCALAAVTTGARRAGHLGIATLGVDEAVAAELERAARAPHAALTMAEAARLLERAAELSGPGPEQARRGTAAAECWQLAGFADRARRAGDRTARCSDDICVRADVQALLARADRIRAHPELARSTLRREAIRVHTLDPARSAAMLLAVADAEALAGEPDAALSAVDEAAARLRSAPGGPPAGVVAGRRASALAAAGRVEEARELWAGQRQRLDEVLAEGTLPVGWYGDLWLWYPMLLLRLARFGDAARLLEELIFQARQRRIDGLLAGLLAIRADLQVRLGAWEDAQSGAAESARRAARLGQSAYQASALLCLARLAAARAQRAECTDLLGQVRRLVDGCRLGSLNLPVAATEGLLALSEGDAEAAYARLESAARHAGEHGAGDRAWMGDYVEAAVRVHRTEDARRRLAEAAGGVSPVLARCAGLLDPEGGERLLRTAAGSREPFEAARAELLLGESLAARGRRAEAVAPLRRARETFDRLGAPTWSARARQPESDDRLTVLTEQEQRVSELVGRGATNRETADRLFLSTKTVEFHLRNIYRKLGLRSRAELAHMVGSQG